MKVFSNVHFLQISVQLCLVWIWSGECMKCLLKSNSFKIIGWKEDILLSTMLNLNKMPWEIQLKANLVFSIHLVYKYVVCVYFIRLFHLTMGMPHMISKHVHMIPFPAVISYLYILFFVICSVTFEAISRQQVFR